MKILILYLISILLLWLILHIVLNRSMRSPCPKQGCFVSMAVQAKESTKTVLYTGKVSYYERGKGCLGCNSRFIMGNEQPLNDAAMTLAIPCEDVKTKKNPHGIAYGTQVRVWNMKKGWVKNATITDCGGFSKYGRVADLSKALMNAMDAKTDQDFIQIYTEK